MKLAGFFALIVVVVGAFFWLRSTPLWQARFGKVDTSHIETAFLDEPYGSQSPKQTLDLYWPNDAAAPYPVIVVIHGGGFMMGNARSSSLASMFVGLDHGYAIASVNYRLSGEATFPAAVNDVRAAVRFLKANAERFELDVRRIAVWGASAGGNLAAMVGTTPRVAALDGDNREHLDYDSSVRAVVDWFGPMDFLAMDAQFAELGIEPALGATDSANSPESRYLGEIISADPARTALANPITYIDSLDIATAPRFLIQHGTADANVPLLQSELLFNALTSALGSDHVAFDLLDGAGHGTAEFSTEANLQRVLSFLDRALDID